MNKFLVDTVDSKDKLIQYFRKGIKKDNELRIGVEHEKFLFNKSDLKRVDYNQIKKVFENLKNNGADIDLITISGGTHSSSLFVSYSQALEWFNTLKNK